MKLFQKTAEKLEKEYQLFLDYLELNEVQLSKRTGIRAGILKIVSKKGKGMTVQKG